MNPAFSAVLLVVAFLAIIGCLRLLFLACVAEDEKKAEERRQRVLEEERAYEEAWKEIERKGRAAE